MICKDCFVIFFTVSLLSHIVSGELVCLSCMGAPTPSDCEAVEKCGSYSHCYLDMIVEDAGAIYFNSGCRDMKHCSGSGRRREAGRNVTSLPVPSLQSLIPAEHPFTNTTFTSISKSEEHLDKTLNHKRSLACSSCCNYRNFCNDNGCGQKGFPATRGPICYSCDQQTTTSDCRQIKVCGRDEICYIEEIVLASDTIFHTSCMSKTKCMDQHIVMTNSPTVSFVGRSAENDVNLDAYLNNDVDKRFGDQDHAHLIYYDDIRERRSTSAQGCCSGDLCNTILPRNGNWGPWTSWGACSSSCGFHGSRQRFRNCGFPAASNGGLPCVGSATETDITCANTSCDKQMICLSCPASVHPRTCNYVETCGQNSVCFVKEYITHAGEIRFKTGCLDKLQCVNGIRKSKRFMVNGDFLSCAECCHGDLCNSHGCGQPGYPALRGPICYSCDQQKDPEHCGKIDVCKDGQKCGLIRHQFIDTIYETKCLDAKSCKSDDITNPDYPKCCSTSLCAFTFGVTSKPNDMFTTALPTKTTNHHGFTTAPPTISTNHHGFTTAPPTKSTNHHGFTTAPATKSTNHHGFTTAPATKSTNHHGFTTAPATKSTTHHGFTTVPPTKSTNHHGFTTAPPTKSTNHHGFTTAPATKSTNHHGFTTAPATKSTTHHGFTTAPATKSTNHHGFTTAPPTKSTNHHGFTTAPATKVTVTPTNHIVGQWTEWTAWSACLETDPNVQGTKERMRQCYDPSHQHTDICTHNHTEKDIRYCFGGQPDACTPPQITDIKIVQGTWELTKLVVVQCFVSGNPMPDVRWLRHTDDVQIYPNDNSKIIIGPIENRHEGSYVCEAFNKCKQSISKSFSTPTLPTIK